MVLSWPCVLAFRLIDGEARQRRDAGVRTVTLTNPCARRRAGQSGQPDRGARRNASLAMNGRVEQFFGTLKERLNHLVVTDFSTLQFALAEFRFWYNCVRPHQHPAGRTPFEAWNNIDPYRHPPKEVHYVTAWDGLLTGYCLRY